MSSNALSYCLLSEFGLDSFNYKGLEKIRSRLWNKAWILTEEKFHISIDIILSNKDKVLKYTITDQNACILH